MEQKIKKLEIRIAELEAENEKLASQNAEMDVELLRLENVKKIRDELESENRRLKRAIKKLLNL